MIIEQPITFPEHYKSVMCAPSSRRQRVPIVAAPNSARENTIVKHSVLLLGVSLASAVSAWAAELQPTDPAASAPPVTYRSAFEGYRLFRDEAIADWRAVNEEVGRVGGHIGIMGGAGGHGGHGATPAKPAASKPATTEGGQAPVRGAPKAPAGGAHH